MIRLFLIVLVLCSILSSCAAPERRAPIDYYRTMYGFPLSQ